MTEPRPSSRKGLVPFLTSTPVLVILALISVAVLIAKRTPRSVPPEERMAAIEAEMRSFQELFDRWDAALNAGDVDSAMAVLGLSPVLMPPGEPEVVGQADVRAWIERIVARGSIRAEHEVGIVQGKDNFFAATGRYAHSIASPNGRSLDETGKWVAVLVRDPDASLFLVRLIWNPDGPATGDMN